MSRDFASFADFYPFYLSQHRNPTCRALHVAGVLVAATAALIVGFTGCWSRLWVVPAIGYGLSWIGHAFFEKNRPAAFRNPFYSLLGDLVMTVDTLRKGRP